MTAIRVAWADANLAKFAKRIDKLNQRFPKALPRIINQVGNRAKTQVIRNLTAQTGLNRRVIVKAIGDPIRAGSGSYRYIMTTRGGEIRFKYLGARETPRGVVAKPFGKRTVFPKYFMRAGWWPNRIDMTAPRSNIKTKRVTGGWKGHVKASSGYGLRTNGKKGVRLFTPRSGVIIPKEMTQGQTAAAFNKIAGPLLQRRVEDTLRKLGL